MGRTQDFAASTGLTVEELGAGIRCYTVRPVGSVPRLGVPLVCSALLGGASAAGWLPALPGGVASLIVACVGAVRVATSVDLESLLVMEGIGLQLTTRFASGREQVLFVETASVSEVFITEAVHLDRCIFYMACLLHGNDPSRKPRLVVPFKELLPPLRQLRCVYLGTRALLMGEELSEADEELLPQPHAEPASRHG